MDWMGKGNGQGLKIISKIKFIQYPQGRIQKFLTAGGMGNTKINCPNFFTVQAVYINI